MSAYNKVIIVGPPGSGKTSILGRLLKRKVPDEYNETYQLTIDKVLGKFNVWCFPGRERNFRAAIGATSAIIVIDGSTRVSLKTLKFYIDEILACTECKQIQIIANKRDLGMSNKTASLLNLIACPQVSVKYISAKEDKIENICYKLFI